MFCYIKRLCSVWLTTENEAVNIVSFMILRMLVQYKSTKELLCKSVVLEALKKEISKRSNIFLKPFCQLI